MGNLIIKLAKYQIKFDILQTYSEKFPGIKCDRLTYSLKGKLRSKSKFTQQLIMDSCYLIAVVLDCHGEKEAY